MASTKVVTAIWSTITLTAGAGDTASADIDLQDGYGGTLHVKLTNGGTGPTVAAEVQVQMSGDDTEYYGYGGPLTGNTDSSGVSSWTIPVPIGTQYLRLVAGSNTGQDVVVDADVTEVTALS